MKLKKLLLTSLLLVLLSGCATTAESTSNNRGDTVDTSHITVTRVPMDIPRIEPVVWRDFEWMVLNEQRVTEMLTNEDDFYFFALSYEDYMNLSLNMQDIVRFTTTQRLLINEIREYYKQDE